jgi:hypothetical protein
MNSPPKSRRPPAFGAPGGRPGPGRGRRLGRRHNGGDNSAEVARFEAHITAYAKQYGQKTVVWDNGYTGLGDDQFGLLNRGPVQWQRSNIVNAIQAAAS